MIPPFPIEGGIALAASRAMSVGGLMAAFGATLFRAAVAPPGLAAWTYRRLDGLVWASLAAALAGAILWLVMQTADLAETLTPGNLRAVLADTQFGHLLAWRLGLLGLAACAYAIRQRLVATCLAATALVLQAGHSHAQAMYGPGWLLLSSALHLLAAGAWLGSLVPLLIICVGEPPGVARRAAQRFSPLGMGCVAALAVTAATQSAAWIGDVPGLLGTGYGWVASVKIGLFAALVLFAAYNWRLHASARVFGPIARRSLVGNIVFETFLGLAIVFAAGVLTELPPSMHVQKLWPFPWTVSLAAVREDLDTRTEAIAASAALVLAVCLLVFGLRLLRKRGRLRLAGGIAGVAALSAAAFAAPHLGPLLVPAVPTEYFRSPTGYNASSIADGEPLYRAQCTTCHGTEGRGDGPASHDMAVPPADLTAAHLFMHSDGQLFWWIRQGMMGPDGRLAMPGFATLSDNETWALIDFLRARNTGLATRGDGRIVPIAAPDFAITCLDGTKTLSALRGRVVELVFGPGMALAGLSAVLVSSNNGLTRDTCTADRGDWKKITRAYTIATGQSDLPIEGALIDANGWLRTAWRTDHLPDDASLRTIIAFIEARPLAIEAERPADTMPADMKML